jgi:membrane-associated protein
MELKNDKKITILSIEFYGRQKLQYISYIFAIKIYHMLETLKETLLNPLWYIENGGLWVLLMVIFSETGLFVGFFLPGDSLLFVAGIYVQTFADKFSTDIFPIHYIGIMLLISIAGIIGNYIGYWFGKKSGPFLYERKDTFFFKRKHLLTAKSFYDKNGALAVIGARFLPIVRTFAPIIAGIVGMDFKKFTLYNIVGSLSWVFSMMLAGKFLHSLFLEKFNFDLTKHLEIIVIGIILITTLPVIFKFILGGKKEDYND